MKHFKLTLVVFLAFVGLLKAQIANDVCSTATSLGILPTPGTCTAGLQDGAPVMLSNLNMNGATASNPDIYIANCSNNGQSMVAGGVDVWYTFVASGSRLNIKITGYPNCSMGVFEGTCSALGGIACYNVDASGTGTLTTASVHAGGTYYLKITSTAAAASSVNYSLSVDNDIDCSNCVEQATLTVSPMPVNGTYNAGQIVNFCYHVDKYFDANTNWFHGVQVTFGNGWDQSTLTTAPSGSYLNPAGHWAWYSSCHSSITGQTFGQGFYFETMGTTNPLDPGDNFGDGGGSTTLYTPGPSDWKFCWSLQTDQLVVTNTDLHVTINTTGDGESGSWSNSGCATDDSTYFTAIKVYATNACSSFSVATSSNNVSCFGLSDGSITVTPSGGTAPYTYTWTNGVTDSINANLPAGTYLCNIIDSNTCLITKTITITQPATLTASATQSNVACFGGATGQATVAASGGTTPYKYAWAPSGGTAATETGLIAGTYTCTISDTNACSIVKTFTVTEPTTVLAISTTSTAATCGNANGQATATATGGAGAYTYTWTPIGLTGSTINAITAGNYNVMATDANGCTISSSVVVAGPSALVVIPLQTNVTCNGNANGSATVNVSGGAPNYTYAWTPTGETTSAIYSLVPGNYTCTITDTNSCFSIKTFTITEPAILSNTTSQTDVSCNAGANGTATVVVSGGTQPYTYSWSPITANTSTVNGLTAGNYLCTISDSNSCVTSAFFGINEPSPLSISIQIADTMLCPNDSTLATAILNNGTSTYSYLWSNGGIGASAFLTVAGNTVFHVDVTDLNNCTATDSIKLYVNTTRTIAGSILNPTGNYANGTVALLKYPSTGHLLDTSGIQVLSSNNYSFNVQSSGDYIVSYTPVDSSMLQTYGYSAFLWDFADIDHFNCKTNDTLNIVVLDRIVLPFGTGLASGYVTSGAGYGSNGAIIAPGTPLSNVRLVLADSLTNQALWETYTDMTGYYQFDSVTLGSYIIYADIPGLTRDSNHYFNITSLLLAPHGSSIYSQTFSGLNFYADSSTIYISQQANAITESVTHDHFIMYPNPAENLINIKSSEEIKKVEVCDMIGRSVIEMNSIHKSELQLNITNLVNGVYYFSVYDTKNNKTVRKIIVNK